MRTRTTASLLSLSTLWLLLSACSQTPTSMPSAHAPSAVAVSTPSTQVHTQSVPTIAVTVPATQVVSWGYSTFGETTVPTLPAGHTYTAIAADKYFAAALTSDGTVKAWGDNDYGQTTVPASLATQTTTALAVGSYHVLALTSDGQITAWGDNRYGQINVPALPDGQTYTAIMGGQYNSAALTSTGQVKVWGYSVYGLNNVPASLSTTTTTALAVGTYHMLALTSDGQIKAWGTDQYGYGLLDVPTLPAGSTYTAVAAGVYHSLALTSDGQIKAWGANFYGELNVPPLPTGTKYVAISASTGSSAALRSDGVIVTWGTLGNQGMPPPAPTGFHYTAISPGQFFGLAIAQADNTAPSAPGALVLSAGSTPNSKGAFTLSWKASTDADGNALTYTLESKSSVVNAQWTPIASGLTTPSSALSDVAEGTWTYRVKANDGIVDGPYSPLSAPIVVDKTAPSAPTVTINGAAPISGWYKDSAVLDFSGSTDPVLADTSAGSGVKTYQGGQRYTTSSTYSGTATDNAGNVSPATTGSFLVDATAPSGAFGTCPTTVGKNSVQRAGWSASDGQSGLATPASGMVTLDTTTLGTHTATVTANDNVGHATTFSCTYTVAYSFQGFFSPVDNFGVLNVAKAGSSIPVKFSLSGNQGLNILASGYPRAVPVACTTGLPADDIETTVTATASGLQYDALTDTYTYVWKTAKSLVGCYRLEVLLNDTTLHTALFQLK